MINVVKKIGVIVEVNDKSSKVGVYNLTNDSEIIFNGEVLNGPKKGAYLTIYQNELKIISKIISEKVLDQQNSVKSIEFDNRYRKNSINRLIELKPVGVIFNKKFQITSKFVPMIGNEVAITTKEEMKYIYSVNGVEDTIHIGNSLLENYPIDLPLNTFFASHIGIFGNTGSGKSNTLHKLYLELFKSKYWNYIRMKSQFYVIDFNGEYLQENQFNVNKKDKKIFRIDTRNIKDKIPIKKDYIIDSDILAVLFDARPATQVPFLKTAIEVFKGIDSSEHFANIEMKLLEKLIINHKAVLSNSLDDWIQVAQSMNIDNELFKEFDFDNIFIKNSFGNLEMTNKNIKILEYEQITEEGKKFLKFNEIKSELIKKYEGVSTLKKLKYFLGFQKVFVTAWKNVNSEHINPLFKRIDVALESLEKVIDVSDNDNFKTLNIISLVNANNDIKRLLPMLLSKMIYDEQKKYASKFGINKTKHLIIDEAHNILNSQFRRNGDEWQDYRLSIFEEIIKEGRKFGFYLTLSSQRPADISETILSQVHNYIIHRLVNENDLHILSNSMSTLDSASFNIIPNLGQGEAIITGTAISLPIFVKIDKEKSIRPKSDDVVLTEIWK